MTFLVAAVPGATMVRWWSASFTSSAAAGSARPWSSAPVRYRHEALELLQEVGVVEPADAAAVAAHRADAVQDQGTGAHPHQRDADGGGLPQERDRPGAQRVHLVDEAADHHHVVEVGRVRQARVRLDRHATARRHRTHRVGQHAPSAQDGTAAVPLVGGEAEHVHEIGEGAEREVPRQDEADAEPRSAIPSVRRMVHHGLCHGTIPVLSRTSSSYDASVLSRGAARAYAL